MAGKNLTESFTFKIFVRIFNFTKGYANFEHKTHGEFFAFEKRIYYALKLFDLFSFEDKLLICTASIRPKN